MNVRRDAGRKSWPSALVVAVGLLLMTVLAACGVTSASTATPEGNTGTSNDDNTNADLVGAQERDGEAAIGATAPKLADYQTYQWVGVIVEGSADGPHLEIKTDCDAWVLLPANDEIEQKLRDNIGKKLTVWGEISYESSRYKQPIKVSAAHAEGDVVIDLYVPDYPCPGQTEPGKPLPPDYGSGYSGWYGGIDLQKGEIAVIGRLVQADGRWFLETESGKVALSGNVKPNSGRDVMPPIAVDPMPMPEDCVMVESKPVVPPDAPVSRDEQGSTSAGYGCATPGGYAGVPGVDDDWDNVGYTEPAYCRPASDDTLVVGRWSVNNGALAMDVRYTQPWGEYVCEYPTPKPVEPQPTPDTSMGVIYGRVEVGPLCPVEPCSNQDLGKLFDGKYLVLEAVDGGEIRKLPLTPDGWFKEMLSVGVYTARMEDCPWMGCDSVFPMEVRVAYDVYDEVVIRIDTGIR